MLKRAETLQEVSMVEHLNSEELRRDPWNPTAPLLAVVNANDPDDDAAVLILERLQPYDAVPCETVRDVVDLARQLLQVCKDRKYDGRKLTTYPGLGLPTRPEHSPSRDQPRHNHDRDRRGAN
jgi:hypothetical protein